MNPKESGYNFLGAAKRNAKLAVSLAGAWAIACNSPERSGNPFDPNAQFLPNDSVTTASRQEFLQATIGQECNLPRIEFRRWNNPTKDSSSSAAGGVLPPMTPGGVTTIMMAENMLDIDRKYAREIGITDAEFKQIKDKIIIFHEAIHACSPYEANSFNNRAPIVEYPDPIIYLSGEKAINRVYLTRERINPGLTLEAEVTVTQKDGKTQSHRYYEPGNTEELITHWLTRQEITKRFGQNSNEMNVLNKSDPYRLSQGVLTTLFAQTGLKSEQVLDAKKKKDIKPIFDAIRLALINIGNSQGIAMQSNDLNSQNWTVYGILTNLSTTESFTSKVDPNTFFDLFGEFYYGRRFAQLDQASRTQISSLYSRIFKN